MSKETKLKRFNRISRQAIVGFLKRKDPAEFFVLIMSVSLLVYLSVYLYFGNGSFVDTFFLRCGDLFMDYFNSIRDAAQGAGVYTVRKVIYPPLANLIFLIISQFAPHGFNQTSFANRKDWIYYPSAILLVTLFMMVCCLVLFCVFREKLKKSRLFSCIFAFFVIFNCPVLYMFERGNILILCFIALAVFGFTYDSESKVKREISIIALAVAASLKLYPALFMWFFIADKRYKELFRCIAYTVLLIILPSFFFGGPACLITLLQNTFSFSSKPTTTTSAITIISDITLLPVKFLSIGSYIWCFVCLISFMASALCKNEPWKLWVKGIILILTAPPLTSLYVWSFFLIPIVTFSNSRKATLKDVPFLVCIFVPFIFFLFRANYYLSTNSLLVYMFTALLSAVCLVDTVLIVRKKIKDKEIKEPTVA